MKHIMLDLETLSTEPNAMITAIGAVVMDFDLCELGESFECQINLDSYKQECGFDISASTVKWWLLQPEESQQHMTVDGVDYKHALFGFHNWCQTASGDRDLKNLTVWGNGATFDNVIMRRALTTAIPGATQWPYQNDRCYRTIKNVFPKLDFKVDGLTAHRSLDDAKYQALYLLELHKHVGLNLP